MRVNVSTKRVVNQMLLKQGLGHYFTPEMCGRAYSTYTDDEIRARYMNRQPLRWAGSLKPNYNLAPTQSAPIVRELTSGERQLDLFRWQYVPHWEPEFKTKLSTINAKSETVFTSRTYKDSILHRRCIVPVSGFFEWRPDDSGKTPFRIFGKDQPILSLAGIWSEWGQGAERKGSFAILTTAANDFMRSIHDRMPVILNPHDEAAWLNPGSQTAEEIRPFLVPCASKRLQAIEVITLVNSPKNNVPQVLEAPPGGECL